MEAKSGPEDETFATQTELQVVRGELIISKTTLNPIFTYDSFQQSPSWKYSSSFFEKGLLALIKVPEILIVVVLGVPEHNSDCAECLYHLRLLTLGEGSNFR